MKKIRTVIIIVIILAVLGVGAYIFYNQYWLHKDDTHETIEVAIEEEAKDIAKLSKPELLAMTAKEVKKSLENYIPNYKEVYGYPANTELTDEQFLQIRDKICIDMYGSLAGGIVTSPITNDPNAIYYAPNVGDIRNLSNADFGIYLNNAYTYLFGEDYLKDKGLDFSTLDDESLTKEKEDFIALLEKNNGNVSSLKE